MVLRPNPECTSYWCRKQQAAYKERTAAAAAAAALCPAADAAPAEVVELHASNDWGIEIEGDDDEVVEAVAGGAGASGMGALAEGVQYAHVSSSQVILAIGRPR